MCAMVSYIWRLLPVRRREGRGDPGGFLMVMFPWGSGRKVVEPVWMTLVYVLYPFQRDGSTLKSKPEEKTEPPATQNGEYMVTGSNARKRKSWRMNGGRYSLIRERAGGATNCILDLMLSNIYRTRL